ncbi:MAG: ubiquinone biosynthesis accessory factor UbiJ [Nevskiaceae bacterium]
MSAPPLLCAALEIAVNRYLALEPAVAARVGALEGRVIALHALGPGWEFYLCPRAQGVTVLDTWPGQGDPKPDVRISAQPAALLRRAFGGAEAGVPGVQVEGDADLLQRFSTLMAGVGFDSEEWLARFMGGGAAHRVDQVVRDLLGWGRRSASTLALDTAEYLREETRDLAHREDVAKWSEGVEAARKRGEQLAARLDRLERRR